MHTLQALDNLVEAFGVIVLILIGLGVLALLFIGNWKNRLLVVLGAVVGGAVIGDWWGLILGAFFGALPILYKKQPESPFARRQRELRELNEEMKLWYVLSPERRADLQARIKRVAEEREKVP
jgi:ABC-type molybdate transport system permease subunit